MTKDEFINLLHKNQRFSGQGDETTTHMPCPFCASPDWLSVRVSDTESALVEGAVCLVCGRGAKGLIDPRDRSRFEMVQTCGLDPDPWATQMRRARVTERSIAGLPVTCDFCWHPVVPVWRFTIPVGTVLIETYDLTTKQRHQIKSSGNIGACLPCDLILDSKVKSAAPRRIAKRAASLERFQGMTPDQRSKIKKRWAVQLKKIIPLLSERRKNQQGSDPMDATGLFSTERYE